MNNEMVVLSFCPIKFIWYNIEMTALYNRIVNQFILDSLQLFSLCQKSMAFLQQESVIEN